MYKKMMFIFIMAMVLTVNNSFADSGHNQEGDLLTKIKVISKQEKTNPYSMSITIELGNSVKESMISKIKMLSSLKNVTSVVTIKSESHPQSEIIVTMEGEKDSILQIVSILK